MHDCSSMLENKHAETFPIENVEPNNINNDDNEETKEADIDKINNMQIVSKMIKAFAVGTTNNNNNQRIKKKNTTKQRYYHPNE